MYAIIRAGGKQAKVKAGDVIEIERVKDVTDQMTITPLQVVDEDRSTVSDRYVLEMILTPSTHRTANHRSRPRHDEEFR